MLHHLERAIQVYAQRRDWRTPALCVAYVMATAVVRFAHTGRSTFMLRKVGGWWCRCYRGESGAEPGNRKGFIWFAPEITLTGMDKNTTAASNAPRGGPLPYLALEFPSGAQVM